MKRFITFVLAFALAISTLALGVSAQSNSSKYFSDVDNYQWAINSIDHLYEIGLISGVKAPTEHDRGLFNPSGKVSKAEFSTITYNLIGKNYDCSSVLDDVKPSAWYYASTISMYNHGILERDYITNKVYPSNYISREECFCMIYRIVVDYLNKDLKLSNKIINYKDCREVSTVYYAITDALISNDLISGDSGNIKPKDFITRAEMAVLIDNLIKKLDLKFDPIGVIVPTPKPTLIYNFSDYEIDLITNVAMHEVSCMECDNLSIDITYSDGSTKHYTDVSILYKYHARTVVNQFLSTDPYFPDTIAGCISRCWLSSLTNQYMYSRNATWYKCRQCVIESLNTDFYFPSKVFGATQDPNFYPSSYFKFATIRWKTPWNHGTYYYYQQR